MKCFLSVFFCSLLTVSSIAQNTREDSVQEARRKAELERVRAIRERFDSDPQAFRDSLTAYRWQTNRREAANRLDRYRENSRIDTLKEINLNYGGLEDVPDFVFKATQLEILRINHNKIRKLPSKLRHLEHLKKIYWENNEFEKKPRIGRIAQVIDLRLNDNDLEKVPSFKNLKSLEQLELSGNALTEVPIGKLRRNRNLKELVLKGNPLSIGEAKYSQLSTLKVLKLNKCALKSIDPSLYSLKSLNELQLQENQLTTLPDGISAMSNLTKLSLYKNQISTLPGDLFDIPGLVVVDLYYNQLEKIPSSVSKAHKLEILFLAHNQIYDVPESIGELAQLDQLYLHHNRISALPTTISNLTDLKVLRINHNYLSTFPREILAMKKLTDLDIEHNDIRTVPSEINRLKNLRLFTFEDNEIDFSNPENQPLAEAVIELMERGVICKPEISREFVNEEGDPVNINTNPR